MCAVCAPLPTRRTERVDPSVAEREEQSQQKTAILAYFSNVWRMFDDVEMRVRAGSDLRGESVLGRVVWQRAASPVEMCRRLRRCKQRFYEDW